VRVHLQVQPLGTTFPTSRLSLGAFFSLLVISLSSLSSHSPALTSLVTSVSVSWGLGVVRVVKNTLTKGGFVGFYCQESAGKARYHTLSGVVCGEECESGFCERVLESVVRVVKMVVKNREELIRLVREWQHR